MIDWRNYFLTELPFVQTKVINIRAEDVRLNGRLFCESIEIDAVKKFRRLIDSELSVIYISPQGGKETEILGEGKSTLLAHEYWELKDKKLPALWFQTTGFVSATGLVAQLYDTMIAYGYLDRLKKGVPGLTDYETVKKKLGDNVPPGLAGSVHKVLNAPDEEAARVLANMRRSTWTYSGIEILGIILDLFKLVSIDRFYIFIDQFEEYVLHSNPERLGNDVNDMLRAFGEKATLIVTMHPDAESRYTSAAGSYINTLARIDANTTVELSSLDDKKAVELATFYLDRFRVKTFKEDRLYPFDENVVRYLAYKSNGNIRDFLNALRRSLFQGAHEGYIPIDDKFISDPKNHQDALGQTVNEWPKFKKSH